MNLQFANDVIDSHIRDLQRLAGQPRGRSHSTEAGPQESQDRRSRLRRRIGFTLIETGLRLIAGPADIADDPA